MHKPPMKLLSPKAAVRIGQWNVRTFFGTGERKRRRPQHTWRRTRIAELEKKHLRWNETKGTAQNGVRWRVLVEELCANGTDEEQ